MTPERQKKIDNIQEWFQSLFGNTFLILFLLGMSTLIKPLMEKLGFDMANYSWYPIICAVYKYTAIILGIVSIIAFCITVFMSIWASDDEKEKKKAEIREILQEFKKAEQLNRTLNKSNETVKCPLVNVNEEQKEAIIQLLKRRITKHEKDDSRFDRSVVYTYLRALRSMNKIEPIVNSEDIDDRRKWIEQITGLYEPQDQWAHFRGDYDENKRNRRVNAVIKELESEIEKFR